MELITSRSNPRIKQTRALQQRRARQEAGLFLVEGIRHVGEAVAAAEAGRGGQIEAIYYAPDLLTSPFGRDLVEVQSRRNVPCFATSAEVFASLAEKENPQGLLAVVRQPRMHLADLKPGEFSWGVALVAPQDPGNIGAILRTIDAVGAHGLLLLDGGADPYHPGSVRASMGAIFWYPPVEASFAEFADWARKHHYAILGTSAHASFDYRNLEAYPRPAILLLGSEREGLTEEQAAACTQLIRLPMRGRVTSLNLAVAAGVLLYDMLAKSEAAPDRA
jgi:TrmH family RNA methyltransferase